MTRIRQLLRTTSQRGYSLVEVLVSAGLLAGVLLSISTMFIAGSQSVRSGRDLTKATTLANSAVEEVLVIPYELVYGLAGGLKTNSTVTWNTDLADPTFVGTPQDIAFWTEIVNDWRDQVQEQLQEGLLTYRVDGISRLPTVSDDGLEPFVESIYLRVTVTVAWTESRGRRRHVTFEGLVG